MADPSPEAIAAALHAYWHAPPAVSEEDAMAGALRAAAATTITDEENRGTP